MARPPKLLTPRQRETVKNKSREHLCMNLQDTYKQVSEILGMTRNTLKKNIESDASLWDEIKEIYDQNMTICGAKGTKALVDVVDTPYKKSNYDGVRLQIESGRVLTNRADRMLERRDKLKQVQDELKKALEQRDEAQKELKKITSDGGQGGLSKNVLIRYIWAGSNDELTDLLSKQQQWLLSYMEQEMNKGTQ